MPFAFNIGDSVVCVEARQACPVGVTGVVVGSNLIPAENGERTEEYFAVRIDEESGFTPQRTYTRCVSDKGLAYISAHGWDIRDTRYWNFPARCLNKLDTSKKRIVTCDRCGKKDLTYKMVRAKNGKYICKNCMEVKSYLTRNESKIGRPTKAGWTFGFEFECIPNNQESSAVLVGNKYRFVPTRDGSLAFGGVEFKTPIISGRSSLRRMFETADKMVRFSDSSCGQHINIGNSTWMNERAIRGIKNCSNELFGPLAVYMYDNRRATVKVCGRYFKSYCNYDSRYQHGSWLNLDHDNRVEFRISKFKNPEQYYNLTNMWVEMLDYIHKHYTNCGETSMQAQACGQKLVEIFKKYAKM